MPLIHPSRGRWAGTHHFPRKCGYGGGVFSGRKCEKFEGISPHKGTFKNTFAHYTLASICNHIHRPACTPKRTYTIPVKVVWNYYNHKNKCFGTTPKMFSGDYPKSQKMMDGRGCANYLRHFSKPHVKHRSIVHKRETYSSCRQSQNRTWSV